MLPRSCCFIVLGVFVARAFWRLVDGIARRVGAAVRRAATARCRPRGVQMVRDPVCGTFVLPDHALTLGRRRARLSSSAPTACRDKYRAREPHEHRISLRADIVEVGRRMYARGYTASNDGNISVRLDAGSRCS